MSKINLPQSQKVFALVDCNNFYVSCERVFAPHLEKRAVAILSNNDGCLVARSDEVKNAGIPMGAPYFKYKEELKRIKCEIFSSNYALYGDMSRRVMSVMASLCEEMEIYSIDEAFLDLTGVNEVSEFCRYLKDQVLKRTGIPVSIGIANTKTLAKLANNIAKKDKRKGENKFNGVFNFLDLEAREKTDIFEKMPLEEVWGIGRQYTKLLEKYSLETIQDLLLQPREWIKKKMTIQGLRLVNELQGVQSYSLEMSPNAKKSIASTRSFGKPIIELSSLSEAIASYCTRIGEKLRKEKEVASYIQVFLMTDRFKSDYKYYSLGIELSTQTNYTPELIQNSLILLKKIFKKGLFYKKAGVIVTGLVNSNLSNEDLFSEKHLSKDTQKTLMQAMDRINIKYGRSTLRLAQTGFSQEWKMNRKLVSPRYTTVWQELLVVGN
jgi:DNA polymerase V